MTAILELPEPRFKISDRSMEARYDTGLILNDGYEDKKVIFVFSVGYTKAGYHYFSGTHTTTDHFYVGVTNEMEHEGGAVSFMLGGGLGVRRIEQKSNRFSRKKMQEIFTDQRIWLEGVMSAPPEMLDDVDQMLREKILPYWNGMKAGIR